MRITAVWLGLTFGTWLARRCFIETHRVNLRVWVLVSATLALVTIALYMQDVKIFKTSDLADLHAAFTWATCPHRQEVENGAS